MAKVFRLMFREQEALGFAEADLPAPFALPYSGRVESWQPLTLNLRDGDYPDYLASSLACRLCSERLMHLLDRTASREDLIQWLRVIVRKGDQERSYYILHFPSPPDVLNKELTIFAGEDFVVKPVLSAHALRMHRVFSYPKNEGLPLFVAEEVKREIEAVGCTGLDLTPVPVV